MKWSLIQLQKYRGKKVPIEQEIDVTEYLKEHNHDVRSASLVNVSGNMAVRQDSVSINLVLEGTIVLPCARTFEDVIYTYHIESIETYVDKEEKVLDETHHLMDGDKIDALPVIEELLLLEIPMQVYSDNVENALSEGNDWNVITEEELEQQAKQAETRVDPRLAGLADFFDKEEN
ncbi:YceD family protein [Listeria rocourtiae]|uniref:YceD family protein n=1 Tax=Listeria rocourtiae TaxID=647910 RepID=UPI003D2F6552